MAFHVTRGRARTDSCTFRVCQVNGEAHKEEIVRLATIALCGGQDTLPEGALDWVVGGFQSSRTKGKETATKEPQEVPNRDGASDEIDFVKSLVDSYRLEAVRSGVILGMRNEDTHELVAVAFLADRHLKASTTRKIERIICKCTRTVLGGQDPIVSQLKKLECGAQQRYHELSAVKKEFQKTHVKRNAHIHCSVFAVHPQLQDEGIGSKLMEYVTRWADGRGLDLYTEVVGLRNIQFFGKADFKSIERKNKFESDGTYAFNASGGYNAMLRESRPI